MNASRDTRTRDEVLAAQRTVRGCCADYQQYRPCDCLERVSEPTRSELSVTELGALGQRLYDAAVAVYGRDKQLFNALCDAENAVRRVLHYLNRP